MAQKPLVSVGIPTYKRTDGLKRTLACMQAQTYENVEIIVSDNNASVPDIDPIIDPIIRQDERIHYFKQKENIGSEANFLFVLQKASGKYFMWAADDDLWNNFFIDELVKLLEREQGNLIAANFEAQYVDDNNNPFGFFPEGRPFYDFESNDAVKRLKHILAHNYGNLIYSLYRREIFDKCDPIFVKNEIPLFLQAASYGNWKVLPDVGFSKRTTMATYRQAKWEKSGGILIRPLVPIRQLGYIYTYHKKTIGNIELSIDTLNINRSEARLLKAFAGKKIWAHFTWLVLGYKPKPR
ncbi:MAG: glycosyltransferase family 2 protein [Anaerolineales bacterium]